MKKIIMTSLIGITFVSSLLAYSATCDTGKQFHITVENKVMTIDGKYRAEYEGKTLTGWYKYSNKSYTYKVGKFDNGQFPIEVSNEYGKEYSGICHFD